MAPRLRVIPLLLLLLGPACGGGGDGGGTGPSDPVPTALRAALQPSGSTGSRRPFLAQPAVQLMGDNGRDVAKAGITITATQLGGGTVLGTTSATTDETGRATFTDLAPSGTVGLRRLLYSSPGLRPDSSALFRIVGGAATTLAAFAGDHQGGLVGTAVTVNPLFVIEDQDHNPVAGQVVAFTLPDGGGVTAVRDTSDATGRVAPGAWTLAPRPGLSRLVATIAGPPSLADTVTSTAFAGPASRLEVLAGEGQQMPVFTAAPIAPVLRVRDRFDNPVPQVILSFITVSGGGQTGPGSVVTDSAGLATYTGWSAGRLAGPTTLAVSALGVGGIGEVHAVILPDPPAVIRRFHAPVDTLIAPTGYGFPDLDFEVVDQYGNPVGAMPVTVTAVGGTVDSLTATTRPDGHLSPGVWRLGPVAGFQQLQLVAGAASYVQQAFAHPGRVLVKVQGDSQSAEVGSPVAVDPVLRVTDSVGQPVAGVPVSFTTSGSQLTGPTAVTTDAQGEVVAAGWTAGTIVTSSGTLTADALGLAGAPATFTLSTHAGPPHHWTNGYGPVTGLVNAVPIEIPTATLVDLYGNVLPGLPLQWTVRLGGGSLSAADSVTDSTGTGRARGWILGSTAGRNVLVLHTPGIPDSITYTTSGIAGPADTLLVQDGAAQVGAVRRPLLTAPVFELRDPYGNVLSNVPVSFTVVQGGGSLLSPSATTDGFGRASPGTWTLGPIRGTQTIRAQAVWHGQVTLTLQTDLDATAVQPGAALLAAAGGSGQTLRAGVPSPMPIGVRVTDSTGFGVEGDTVQFTVTGGGGSLPAAVAVTDTGGFAVLYGWSLGSGANAAAATHPRLPAQSVQFAATGLPAGSAFDITVDALTALPANVQSAFDAAAARWRAVILSDIPDVTVSLAADACFTGQPALNGPVDDLLLFVEVVPLDGTGGVLGGTGICAKRAGTALPSVAVIILDIADMAVYGTLVPEIVLHEVGHALGIGSAWQDRALVLSPGSAAPRYLGGGGRLGYWALRRGVGFTNPNVPVEGSASPAGSRDVHWEEATFDRELMTPYIDGGGEPLSLLTAASLTDLGYVVDLSAADGNFVLQRQGPPSGRVLHPGWELVFPGAIPPGVTHVPEPPR